MPPKPNIRRKNPNALNGVYERLGKTAEREIAVGFPMGKALAYPDGTRVVDVAATNVFGTDQIPARDFFAYGRNDVIRRTGPTLKQMVAIQNKGGKEEAVEALRNAAGLAGEAAIRQAIIDLDQPPNAEMTIAMKGSENPLIDTGHLKNSVTYVIRNRTT